ncbi:hypothetical protein SAMN05660443_1801 [Marinospirillum celere]|uniref:DUF2169 domain-containing protein n=1 Tax=Marinospirillum celere TaxID=1122252 RepID=A0A1I1H503_9GAMM|nr:DUF2169 domain-containing protein [Marinospirillum celere]SFC18891.1 hypothetical protein SAMN05660443_1801 [Marinospirillum celere]
MQIIKPLQLSCLTRPLTYQGSHYLVISALYPFDLEDPSQEILEQEMWLRATEVQEALILDAGFPKPFAEFLVYGSAFSPNSRPVRQLEASIQVGSLTKQLLVQGESYWQGLPGFETPSQPFAFTQMPLTAESSYGGEGFIENPAGKGHTKINTPEREERYPFPSVQLVQSPQTRPGASIKPAYTGAMDWMHPKRQALAGSYGEPYQTNAMPGLPDDFDWTFFQEALPDQRFSSKELPLGCDYQLINLHPDLSYLTGKVPNWQTKLVVSQQEKEPICETLHPETLLLLPAQKLGIVVYRNLIKVARDDGKDVTELLLALEDKQQPKPADHYLKQLHLRQDSENDWLYLLNTQPLLPEGLICGFKQMMEAGEITADASGAVDNTEAFAERKAQEVETEKERLLSQLPDNFRPEEPVVEPHPLKEEINKLEENLKKALPEKENGDLDIQKVDLSLLDKLDADLDNIAKKVDKESTAALVAELKKLLDNPLLESQHEIIQSKLSKLLDEEEAPLWPRADLRSTLNELKESLANQEAYLNQNTERFSEYRDLAPDIQKLEEATKEVKELEQSLETTELEILELYRQVAERSPKGTLGLTEEELRLKREAVLTALKEGQPLPTRDLADLDLSYQNLEGADLENCYMEGVNLEGTRLRGANLKGTVLVYSTLEKTDFTEANLQDANLGSSHISNAFFDAANLNSANFNLSRVHKTSFKQSSLKESQWMETEVSQSNFTECLFTDLALIEPHFINCDFSNTRFEDCSLIDGQLPDCQFNQANLEGMVFVNCNLESGCFDHAQMDNVRFMAECSLQNSSFLHASLLMASFREAHLEGSRFNHANMNASDFEEASAKGCCFDSCQWSQANLYDCNLSRSSVRKVNLSESTLTHADLSQVDFTGSNLYACNFNYATYTNTNFDFCNLDRSILEKWHPS